MSYRMVTQEKNKQKSNTASVGFEEKLWAAADKMRNNMDPAEYKHVILGLIFLKYISDSFEEKFKELEQDELSDPEDREEYVAENIFWVPKDARWTHLKNNARSKEVGKFVDDAMIAIEKENETLRGVLPKQYARPDLDKSKLGEIIDLISDIDIGNKESQSKDMLGRIYEYFIGRFASAEGKGGGEFYTPSCAVRLLVEMLEPYEGRVFDPCCGSGGMFVQSEKFVEAHGGNKDNIAIYGQESNPTTWRLAKMNLAIRGISGNLGAQHADSLHNDQHKNLKADFIIANPPFNISDWGGDRLVDDIRWKYGVPPTGNANYAWIQHFIHHLSPAGIAGFVMANGSLSSNTSGEGDIRKSLIQNGLVDCIVAMPDKLFYTTGIPACLWFVSRDRYNNKFRDRHNEVLFIDARKLGTMVNRKLRELTEEEILRISDTYHQWRSKEGKYEDIKGFCKAANIEELEKNNFVLTPGRYVGFEAEEEDDEAFDEKMSRLTKELSEQFAESKVLEERIKKNLTSIGFSLH
jgi:type I restriction enzyme M protein